MEGLEVGWMSVICNNVGQCTYVQLFNLFETDVSQRFIIIKAKQKKNCEILLY